MLKTILIRSAAAFDPVSEVYAPETDILIENGYITRMEQGILPQPGWEVVEGKALKVSQGWTDCHTHLENFDPALSYPSLGVTRIHDAGSFGAFNYPTIHDVISRLPYPVTSYLYVGCYGVGERELLDLDNLKPEPFYEVAAQYPGEIVGAKIRIDPRVNCDTKKSLRMAKEVAVHAGLPLIVHPSRTKDSLEEILDVMEKGDVYAHTYSPVAPSLFDEAGRIKQCAWDAMKRGVRFDLSHGSNNFSYAIARKAMAQGFSVETVSTDLHLKNYNRPGISLAGVMTKAIQAGMPENDALRKVINPPLTLLGLPEKAPTPAVGQPADITIYQIIHEDTELPDSQGNPETCHVVIRDVATVIGQTLNRSRTMASPAQDWWHKD